MREIARGMKAYFSLKGNDCKGRKNYIEEEKKRGTGVRKRHLTGGREKS